MDNNEKQITDMYLAAALRAYGFTMIRVDKSNHRKQRFYFSGECDVVYTMDGVLPVRRIKPTIDDVEMFYHAGKLMFPPTYPESVKAIKSVIHLNVSDNKR